MSNPKEIEPRELSDASIEEIQKECLQCMFDVISAKQRPGIHDITHFAEDIAEVQHCNDELTRRVTLREVVQMIEEGSSLKGLLEYIKNEAKEGGQTLPPIRKVRGR